jgi:two-component sensor histidine kinase
MLPQGVAIDHASCGPRSQFRVPQVPSLQSYGLALGLVAVAAIVRFILGLYEESVLYFACFYPAILLAALWGGAGPGLLAMAASLLTVWYIFLPPPFSPVFKDRATWLNLAMFCASSGLLVWIADRYRRALDAIVAAEETRRLMADEMRHRTRNSLAIAQTLVNRTLADDPVKAATLMQRLRIALDPGELLNPGTAGGEALHRILTTELQPYGLEKFNLDGEPVTLNATQSRNMALIVHELTTNAAKYGALANGSGKISIAWRVTENTLALSWRENSTAANAAPSCSSGFGTRLIDAMVRGFGGEIDRSFGEGGFACRIVAPLKADEPARPPERPVHMQ